MKKASFLFLMLTASTFFAKSTVSFEHSTIQQNPPCRYCFQNTTTLPLKISVYYVEVVSECNPMIVSPIGQQVRTITLNPGQSKCLDLSPVVTSSQGGPVVELPGFPSPFTPCAYCIRGSYYYKIESVNTGAAIMMYSSGTRGWIDNKPILITDLNGTFVIKEFLSVGM